MDTKIGPVWVHTFHPATMDGIKILVYLCERYPDIPGIFEHLGGPNWMEVIDLTSVAFTSIAIKMALTELPEGCLYSSDAPYGESYLYRQLIQSMSKRHLL